MLADQNPRPISQYDGHDDPRLIDKLGKRCCATLQRTAGSGWLLVRPEPRHQFVDAVVRPAVHQACDEIGEIDLRIDAIQLTGLCRMPDYAEPVPQV
jgi:hypothetical protein